MNIFNKVIPWFIPTKEDQRKWYTEELKDNPIETQRLLMDFQDLSEKYNRELGDFEAELAHNPIYERYLNIKVLAQQVNFLWNRIEYKNKRQVELKEMLSKLNL